MTATSPTILAIETSTGPCSVAIYRDGNIAWQEGFSQPGQQAGKLMPLITEGLTATGISFFGIDLIVSSIGPGSFTGIRIGLAAARGIAFATDIATAGYTTLMLLASMAEKKDTNILATLNAGKGDVYWQLFSPTLAPLSEAQIAKPEEAAANAGHAHIISNIEISGAQLATPDAAALAQLAATKASSESLRPFYIRPPDAALPSEDKKLRMSE